jgi:hypothetical protein
MGARIVLVVALGFAAVIWRLVNLGFYVPNVELVTAVAVASGILLPVRYSWAPPLAVIVVSDYLIGNTRIYLFTWSAWAVTAAVAFLLRRFRDTGPVVWAATGYGVVASTWFFLWTNFGVWAQGHGVFYPATWTGLIECYVAGLPFYRNMVIGNLILVPLVAATASTLRVYQGLPRPAQTAVQGTS